jgi:Resolvase, N terminal domain
MGTTPPDWPHGEVTAYLMWRPFYGASPTPRIADLRYPRGQPQAQRRALGPFLFDPKTKEAANRGGLYARVSTDGQSLAAQLAELKAAKCERIYQEKISGARADRKQLNRLIAELDRGDGMPSFRTPPSGFGISTRLTGFGS